MSGSDAALTDHDQLFKTLLPELFQLFFPALAAELLLEQVTFLEKEYFTDFPTGDRRNLDILCRVPTHRQTYQTVLVQTETQESDSEEPIAQRLFRYSMTLQGRHFPERVVSVLIHFATHERPIELDCFSYEALGSGLSLKYYRCSVKSLSAEAYLKGDNPLGWALAVRMKRGRLNKVSLVLQSLAKIWRAPLSSMKQVLLVNCVKTYMKLNASEQVEMQAMLEQDDYQDVKQADLTWAGQLRADGQREGFDKSLRSVYEARFGQLPQPLAEGLARITDTARLKALIRTFVLRSEAEIAAALVSPLGHSLRW